MADLKDLPRPSLPDPGISEKYGAWERPPEKAEEGGIDTGIVGVERHRHPSVERHRHPSSVDQPA